MHLALDMALCFLVFVSIAVCDSITISSVISFSIIRLWVCARGSGEDYRYSAFVPHGHGGTPKKRSRKQQQLKNKGKDKERASLPQEPDNLPLYYPLLTFGPERSIEIRPRF